MKERIKSIDSLRGLSILAVLLIHTTTRTLEASNFNIVGFSWTLFLNQIARFAVPLFFLISGLVLEISYKKGTSYIAFIKKRFSKIFIPYFVWSLFYYFLIYNQNHDSLLKVMLNGSASYQLYFIPTLCIFYLIFPFIHKIYKYISKTPVLVILITAQIYLLYRDYFVKEFLLPDPVHIAILAFIYFLLGIVVARNMGLVGTFTVKKHTVIIPLWLLSGFYVFWEGRSRFIQTGNYFAFYSQWRPSVFVYTILTFFALYYFFEYRGFGNSVVNKFSKYSFFVFFVHVAVLELFWKYAGKNIFGITLGFPGKILFDPVFFISVAFISFFIAKSVRKVSKSEKFLG